MVSRRVASFAMTFTALLMQGRSLAMAAEALDVRTMKDWVIVVAADATECERYAAEEFRDFFAQATGHTLAIRGDSPSPGSNVFIGPGEALKKSDLGFVMDKAYGGEELRVVVRKDNLAIIGGRPRGVLYGVYQFLEDVLGVRFLSKDYTHVPRYDGSDVQPPRGVLKATEFSYTPPVVCRYNGFGDFQDKTGRFAARLRMNGRYAGDQNPTPEWRKKIGGDNRDGLILHNIGYWLGASRKEHPEYFAADKDGKRPVSNQPCFSHPEVIDRITRKALSECVRYGQNGQMAIAQADASLCECERCAALVRKHGLDPAGGGGQNWGAPLFLMINHVAREVAKVRPDVKIATYAYCPSAKPPKGLKMEPNVRIQYCTYGACQIHPFGSLECQINLEYARDIEKWNRISSGMRYWYYGMGSYTDFFAPPVALRMAGQHLRTLVENKAKSIFVQGDPIVFAELVQYVYARLLWNPRLDTYDVINEFVDLYYGKAARPVAEFLRLADNELRHAGKHANCNARDIFKQYGYTDALGWKGIELFDEALKLADTPQVKARVEKASLSAYRLSLGATWLGQQPQDLTDAQRTRLRNSARRLFDLCARHKIVAVHEARRINDAQAAVRKALGIKEGDPL